MDSSTDILCRDATDSKPMLDSSYGLLKSKVVKAEAESATMDLPPVGMTKEPPSPITRGDVTPSKNNLSSRVERIRDSLEGSISDDARKRMDSILDGVKQLSDVEKLLLYLRLPTGTRTKDIPPHTPSSLHLSNLEHTQAFTWIQSHLEEDNETCLRKDEVFDDYRGYCDLNNMKPLNTADFGKVMKRAFPNVKPRRLGQRGQSKYCYSGLRKRLEVQPPSLPDLGECFEKEEERQKTEDEVLMPECIALVCEWAENLLGKSFTSIRELSEHLLSNLYVNSKSTAAFALTAAMQKTKKKDSKVPVSSLFATKMNTAAKGDTQIEIQRRIQEKEMLREQKKKLQNQKEEHSAKEEKRKGVKKLFSPPMPKSEFPEQTSCALQGMAPMDPWYRMAQGQQMLGSAFSSVGGVRPMGHPMGHPGMMPMSEGPRPPMPGDPMQPSTLEELLDPGPPKSSHDNFQQPSTIASGNPELAQALMQKQFSPIKLQKLTPMSKDPRGFGPPEADFYDRTSVASLLQQDSRESSKKRGRDDSDDGNPNKRPHMDFGDNLSASANEQMFRNMQRARTDVGYPGRVPSNPPFGQGRPPSNGSAVFPPRHPGGPGGPPPGMFLGPKLPLRPPLPPYSHAGPPIPEYHTFQTQQMMAMTGHGPHGQLMDKPPQSPGRPPLQRQRSARGSTESPPSGPPSHPGPPPGHPGHQGPPFRVFPNDPQCSQNPMDFAMQQRLQHPMSLPQSFSGPMPPMGPPLMAHGGQPAFPGPGWAPPRLGGPPQGPPPGPPPPERGHPGPHPTPPSRPNDPPNVSDDLQSTLDVLRDFDTQYFNNQSNSDLEDSNSSLTKLLHQNQNDLSLGAQDSFSRRQSEQVVPPDGMPLASDMEPLIPYENLARPKLGNPPITR